MLIWAIVASGLVSVFLWKKANPGKNINPLPQDDLVATNDHPRTSAKP